MHWPNCDDERLIARYVGAVPNLEVCAHVNSPGRNASSTLGILLLMIASACIVTTTFPVSVGLEVLWRICIHHHNPLRSAPSGSLEVGTSHSAGEEAMGRKRHEHTLVFCSSGR